MIDLTNLNTQYAIRFILLIIYFAAVSYAFVLSSPAAFRGKRSGSIALSAIFGSLAAFFLATSLLSPLNLFFSEYQQVWLMPFLVSVNVTLVLCIAAVAWGLVSRRNVKMSEYLRLIQTPDGDLERALLEARERNEQLVRLLDDSRQFLRAAAHDLRAPLRAIIGFVDLIDDEKEDPPNPEYLGQVRHATHNMLALIDDLSILSRIETEILPMTRVDLNKVVAEVVQTFQQAIASKEIQLEVGNLPTVKGMEVRLVQLFQNLIGNAVKFGVTRVKVTAKKRGKEIVLAVEDDGIGIEKEYLNKIFAAFQRLNHQEDYPGTGMGLAICQRIVTLHGGRIWVESQPGQGSIFYVGLPAE